MTTTEFIKLIKSCKEGRNKLHGLNWESTNPSYIITESELAKIEKVNVELLEAGQETLSNWHSKNSNYYKKEPLYLEMIRKAITNASNIKQI